jgi:hypothetical protein
MSPSRHDILVTQELDECHATDHNQAGPALGLAWGANPAMHNIIRLFDKKLSCLRWIDDLQQELHQLECRWTTLDTGRDAVIQEHGDLLWRLFRHKNTTQLAADGDLS